MDRPGWRAARKEQRHVEQDRARLYDWLREQAGEQEAEYLMSCIASVPLTELATKDSVDRLDKRFSAELPKLATKDSLKAANANVLAVKDDVKAVKASVERLDAKFEADRLRRDELREADRDRYDELREADRDRYDELREADRKEAAAQREADSAIAGKRHRLLVTAAILLGAEIVAAEAGWLGWFTDLLASAV